MEDIQTVLEEFKTELKNIYGSRLKQVILYGSWARGEATEESDIDLLVVLKGKVQPGREIDRIIDVITDLNLKYGVLLSVYPISERKYNHVNSPLLLTVKKEGVLA
jgi:predicted nucleotidyltransferase